MSDFDPSGWWSPFFEERWDIDATAIGEQSPRDARRYHPPVSRSSRTARATLMAVVAAPLFWLGLRAATGGETGWPLMISVIAAALGASILVLPRVINPGRGPSYDVHRQLTLAQRGELAYGEVQRVDYARRTTRAGYRDGTAIDTTSGNAHCRFVRKDGIATEVIVPFGTKQPALKDGDRVALLYDPEDPSDCMAVLHMVDIELPSAFG